ncbi:hypothetical protein T492DRAFT_1064425 [Pavlovales sp. CCMP2436]|nr:hypothetical protein T492DRAFT_1064425 [Pavlovales sp. CCMP2436]
MFRWLLRIVMAVSTTAGVAAGVAAAACTAAALRAVHATFAVAGVAGGIASATTVASTAAALRAFLIISAVKDISRATLVEPVERVLAVTRLTSVASACAATALRIVNAASVVTGVAVTLSIALVVVPLARSARASLDAAGALGAWLKRPAPAAAQPARPSAIPARPPAVLCGSCEPSTGQSHVSLNTFELGVATAGMAVGAATALAILPLYAAVTLASSLPLKLVSPKLSKLFRHERGLFRTPRKPTRIMNQTPLSSASSTRPCSAGASTTASHAARLLAFDLRTTPRRDAPRRGARWCLALLVTVLLFIASLAILLKVNSSGKSTSTPAIQLHPVAPTRFQSQASAPLLSAARGPPARFNPLGPGALPVVTWVGRRVAQPSGIRQSSEGVVLEAAAVYHDLGAYPTGSFDLHTTLTVSEIATVKAIIRNKKKLTPFRGKNARLVNTLRKAEWIENTAGLVRFGLSAADIARVNASFLRIRAILMLGCGR